MRRVIDAMNVIGSRPDGWWRDRRAAIERLLGELEGWAAEADEQVVLVLEQPPSPPISSETVEIASAPRPGRDSADQEIVRRLGGWLAEGEATVVTSDRDLAERARSLGAVVEPAAAFRRRLESL
jgi:hypothetical protein